MSRPLNKLTDRGVLALRGAGRKSDGGGLYLSVSQSGAKSWVYMWTPAGGKRREMGLGSYPVVTLAKARELASTCRSVVNEGKDPIAARDATPVPTFGGAADLYIKSVKSMWKSAKHAEQWQHSMTVRCSIIRGVRVPEITVHHVVRVLRQQLSKKIGKVVKTDEFWALMPETAGRVRNRIESVLNYAKANGWRSGENPAAWKGNLEHILPPPKKLIRGHQRAISYAKVPEFMDKLRHQQGLGARAAEVTILTFSRSGEVLGMQWRELDFDKKLWTVPGSRMKMGKTHIVPLCDQVLTILAKLAETKLCENFVFPSPLRGQKLRHLSSMAMTMTLRRMNVTEFTMHGFRSAARDWAGDKTDFASDLVEHALAHKVGSSVTVAYRRETAVEKRFALMSAWGDYCYPADTQLEVVQNT